MPDPAKSPHLNKGSDPRTSLDNLRNRPFPSSCLPPLQSESKCEVAVMVIRMFYFKYE